MKTKIIFGFYATLLFAVLLWVASSGGRAQAANQGNTGAPCEQTTTVCGNCHSSTAYGPVSESVQILDGASPVTEYALNTVYNVTFTVTPGTGTPNGYGFQATALNASNNDAGTWQNPNANVQIHTISSIQSPCNSSRTYVEHENGASISNTFTVEWLSPATDEGNVTFYFVGNCVNNNANTGGDTGGFGTTFSLDAPCIADVTINDDPIADNTNLVTGNTITSMTGRVATGTTVTFDAGNCITLDDQFEVESGATFNAIIGGCN